MALAQTTDVKAATGRKVANQTKTVAADADEDDEARAARIRHVATKHALSIQEKKDLQGKVLDMILIAYDLPSPATTDPAHPDSTDADTFRQCLRLWRPSDLDELTQERNLDDRCGYALCRRPNHKQEPTKVWDKKQGTFVDKRTDQRWCSIECSERNHFVRRQLTTEPAWLRQAHTQNIRLMTDAAPDTTHNDLSRTHGGEKAVDQGALALDRDQTTAKRLGDIPIREKETTGESNSPTITPQTTVGDVLEGMPIRHTGRNSTHG